MSEAVLDASVSLLFLALAEERDLALVTDDDAILGIAPEFAVHLSKDEVQLLEHP